ncbi:tetratricopeptide repeat protein [Halalkalibaculum roseum]|nr:hypothetical protein [Halalkalibaculum roseum]
MNRAIQFSLAVLIIIGLTLTSVEVSYSQSDNDLAGLATAAFVSLDAKVNTGFTKGFALNNDGLESNDPVAPLFNNMGTHGYTITTKSRVAQDYFDQGLKLSYAFNHAEGHRSFVEVARQDPEAAMAFWGQAYALGPNINDPFPDEERKMAAFEAIKRADELKHQVSDKEKHLIEALSKRYGYRSSPDDAISYSYLAGENTDLAKLNDIYAEAMKDLAEVYPNDPDILTMYAAAVMDMMPWNYWDKNGNPNPGIGEAKQALETAIEINPEHPGAHHYYIHMVELPQPDLAIPSAEVLAGLMPAAGHIVHMPSHIFIRVGRYRDAAMTNIKAIYADEDYISQCLSQGLYPLSYYPHNIHFLWASASLMGNSETALAAARKTAEKVPVGMLQDLSFLQDFYSTPLLAYVRFGKWDEILTVPNPMNQKHTSVIWHYARGIAFLRKDNIPEARQELQALEELLDDASLESFMGNFTNSTSGIAKVAYHVLAGEVKAAEGDYDQAIALLQKGVEFEDALVYSEPSAWYIPVRQTLGNILLEAEMPAEAEMVYRNDLKKVPRNGWSLKGLYNSLVAQDKTDQAREIERRFNEAWKDADIEIDSSVL